METSRLQSLELFAGLDAEELDELSELFTETEILAGSGLTREKDFSYKFFVVLDGEVDVLRDFTPVARLGHGEFFGEMGLLQGKPRNARVVAHTPAVLAVMMTWDFAAMTEKFPQIAERIEAVVAERMKTLPDDAE